MRQQLGVLPAPHEAHSHHLGVAGGLATALDVPAQHPRQRVKAKTAQVRQSSRAQKKVPPADVHQLVREDDPQRVRGVEQRALDDDDRPPRTEAPARLVHTSTGIHSA